MNDDEIEGFQTIFHHLAHYHCMWSLLNALLEAVVDVGVAANLQNCLHNQTVYPQSSKTINSSWGSTAK